MNNFQKWVGLLLSVGVLLVSSVLWAVDLRDELNQKIEILKNDTYERNLKQYGTLRDICTKQAEIEKRLDRIEDKLDRIYQSSVLGKARRD